MNLSKVNGWAKKSCPKWNRNRLSRRRYREKYRNAAKKNWESPGHQELISKYFNGEFWVDTYPWPYSDPNFANWEEDDSNENYSLISDQSGCVIKYATSYVAWKIFELTNTWPQKKTPIRMDAKNWQQFLAEAGYETVVDAPIARHYVGIRPDIGEWGLVVWVESVFTDRAYVSTYINKEHDVFLVKIEDYIWIKIA